MRKMTKPAELLGDVRLVDWILCLVNEEWERCWEVPL